MKYNAITTFNKDGLNEYGITFIDTYLKNFPKEIPLHVYFENCDYEINDPRIIKHYHNIDLPKLLQFKEKYKNDLRANGKCPNELRKDKHKTFKWNAIRFANKVYSIFHLATIVPNETIIWIDADTIVHSLISYDVFKTIVPENVALSYLGRGKKWPECGFYSLNLKFPEIIEFINLFEWYYENAEQGIFTLDEWHDSYVFNVVLKLIKQKYPQLPIKDFSGHLINGEGHPLINSELGAYLDHLKGNRKQLGKSKQSDLIINRTEDYWK